MSWEFELIFSPRALKDLKALDKNVQKRIKKATAKLEQYPPVADIIKLEGGAGTELRLRVGAWRVTFEYYFEEKQAHILRVKHRREAYRKRK